ncbi:MAG: matrixin family metalloprotease [Myxococcaceae bacterium]|nr:matrixin family metalloprotease [Myxococcaceae bacterium]
MPRSFLVIALLAGPAFGFELRRDSQGDVVRWERRVEFVVDGNLGRLLDLPGAVAVVKRSVAAFDQAAAAVEVVVRQGEPEPGFELGGENTNAIVVLKDWPFEARNLAATVVTLNAKTNEIIDADILINGEEAFGEPGAALFAGQRHDLQAMMLHEVGHALGLEHNDTDVSSVMFPSLRAGEVGRGQLGPDDLAALATLYPARKPQPPSAPTSSGEQQGCSSAPSLSWVGLLGLVTLALRGRRRRAAALVAPVLTLVASSGWAQAPAREPQATLDEIAWGEVVQTTSRWLPNARLIVTDVQIEVKRCVKGACTERRLQVQIPGGRVGDVEQVLSHPLTLERGTQVVLTRRAGRLKVIPAGK